MLITDAARHLKKLPLAVGSLQQQQLDEEKLHGLLPGWQMMDGRMGPARQSDPLQALTRRSIIPTRQKTNKKMNTLDLSMLPVPFNAA